MFSSLFFRYRLSSVRGSCIMWSFHPRDASDVRDGQGLQWVYLDLCSICSFYSVTYSLKKAVVLWRCGRLPHQVTYFKRHCTISTSQQKSGPKTASTTPRNTQKKCTSAHHGKLSMVNWVSPIWEFLFSLTPTSLRNENANWESFHLLFPQVKPNNYCHTQYDEYREP